MNKLTLDNIFSIADFIISGKIPIIGTTFSLIAIISAILTCRGESITQFLNRLKDWKNRESIKYVIVNAQVEENKEQIYFPLLWGVELMWLLMVILLFQLAIGLMQFIVNNYKIEQQFEFVNSQSTEFVLIVLGVIVFCSIIYKFKMRINNIAYYLVVISILFTCFIIFLDLVIPFDNEERTIMLCAIPFFIILQNYENCLYLFLTIYLVLMILEYHFYYKNSFPRSIEYTIWVKEDKKYKVTSSIFQCNNDLVKYSYNNLQYIIGIDEITAITFSTNHFINYGRKQNKIEKGICYLEEKEDIVFDYFEMLRADWTYFVKIHKHGRKEVSIVHNSKIKQIKPYLE